LLSVVPLATSRIAYHWEQLDTELPPLTDAAIHSAIVWPAAAMLISILGLVLAITSKITAKVLSDLFAAIVILELAVAGLHILGLISPTFGITYGLS